MRRGLFNLLAVGCLLIVVAGLVLLWPVSGVRSGEVFAVGGRHVCSAISTDGQLSLGWHRCHINGPRQGLRVRQGPTGGWVFGADRFQRLLPVRLVFASDAPFSVPVGDGQRYQTEHGPSFVAVIDYRNGMLVSVAVLVWRGCARRTDRRVARWRETECCAECGYDLRATPGGCPECGPSPV